MISCYYSGTVHRGKQSPEGQKLLLWEESEKGWGGESRQRRTIAHFTLVLFPAALSSPVPLLLMNFIVWFKTPAWRHHSPSPQCWDSVLLISKLTCKQILQEQCPSFPDKHLEGGIQAKTSGQIQSECPERQECPRSFAIACNSIPLNYIYCVSTIWSGNCASHWV